MRRDNTMLTVFVIFLFVVCFGYIGMYSCNNLNIFNRNEAIGNVEAQAGRLEVDLKSSSGKLLKAITEQSKAIKTAQEKINKLSEKQTKLNDIDNSIMEKENILSTMVIDSEEYKALLSEIEAIKKEKETLTKEMESLSADIVELLNTDDDVELYNTLQELNEEYKKDLTKLNASYNQLLTMLQGSTEDGELNYKLNGIEISIEKIHKKIALIDMQLGNMASNYEVIKAIDSKLKADTYDKHLIFFNFNFTDNAIQYYLKNPVEFAAAYPYKTITDNIEISLLGSNGNIGQDTKTIQLTVPTQMSMPIVTNCLIVDDVDLKGENTKLAIKLYSKFNGSSVASIPYSNTFTITEEFANEYVVELNQNYEAGMGSSTSGATTTVSTYYDLITLQFNNRNDYKDIAMVNVIIDWNNESSQVIFELNCEGYNIVG